MSSERSHRPDDRSPTHSGAAGIPDYPALLQRVPAIVYTAEPGGDGAWQYVSPQVEAILGYTPQQWCADVALWHSSIHPQDRARVLAEEDAIAKLPEGSLSGALEYRMLHRDGRVVWIRDDAQLVRDTDGVRRWHGVMSDVTDRRTTEAELERAAAQDAAVAALVSTHWRGRLPANSRARPLRRRPRCSSSRSAP